MMINMEQQSSHLQHSLNALELAGKEVQDTKIVISGAGSAALACANLYVCLIQIR
jgi:malic enzyme